MNFIAHYASPYYDPVKAHEYYEEHKKLKGRTSTQGLNEEGRIAAQYVRKSLNEERDQKLQDRSDVHKSDLENEKNAYQQNTASERDSMKRYSEQASRQIANMRTRLSHMPPQMKKQAQKEYSKKIDQIRSSNEQMRESIQRRLDTLKNNSVANRNTINEGYKTDTKNIRDEYSSKYESELNKLKSDSKYVATKKSKKSRSR